MKDSKNKYNLHNKLESDDFRSNSFNYLRNRKRDWVSIELWKHEWKFGRARNAEGTRATGD